MVFVGLLFLFVNKVTAPVYLRFEADHWYKYPELAKQLIEPWYEFEDSTASSSFQSENVGIRADVAKRDAVVNAFKVILC